MSGISQAWNTLITVTIASLPAIGALLLVRSQSQKRKLDAQEIIGIYLIFWGFLLFAYREVGLGYPILIVGLIFTAISIHLIRKHY